MMSEDPEASHHYESWAGRGPSSSSFEAPLPLVVLRSLTSLSLLLNHSDTGLATSVKPLNKCSSRLLTSVAVCQKTTTTTSVTALPRCKSRG